MRAAVIGGKLQGVETAYLARKAGWEVLLIDKNPAVPASGLCDSFIQADVTEKRSKNLLKGVDLVIPALEDDLALAALSRLTGAANLPLAFDPVAYSISSSKKKSERLFFQLGVSVPRPWPECAFPLIAKPGRGSGSRGVRIIHDRNELNHNPDLQQKENWVLQEFLPGDVYSVEVAGLPGQYTPFQVTDLALDAGFDCKRVQAPTELSPELEAEFKVLSVALAGALSLRGIMDVEVILHEGQLKVLEVDARLPSQTPTSIYWSSGLNLVQILGDLFLSAPRTVTAIPPRGVVYEHIKVSRDQLEVAGEHIMAEACALHVQRDFFGADEAISDYVPGREAWVAALIITGSNRKEAWNRRLQVIREIRKKFELRRYMDSNPCQDIVGAVC